MKHYANLFILVPLFILNLLGASPVNAQESPEYDLVSVQSIAHIASRRVELKATFLAPDNEEIVMYVQTWPETELFLLWAKEGGTSWEDALPLADAIGAATRYQPHPEEVRISNRTIGSFQLLLQRAHNAGIERLYEADRLDAIADSFKNHNR